MIYKILMIGPQGSGKGTQSERLEERLGIPTFAMGQLCRDEVASGSDIGNRIKAILETGNLVSDEIAAELLQKRLAEPDTQRGYILDGYPRNLSQYAAFTFDEPTHAIVIEVPRAESLKRLGGRLTCNPCGHIEAISLGSHPGDPCKCGEGTLRQRADDTPEAINRRLDIYEHDTNPVIAEYEKKGIVHRVDGMGSIEEVAARIQDALGV